jgi:hypothetical protein
LQGVGVAIKEILADVGPDHSVPLMIEAVAFVAKLVADPAFKKSSGLFVADFITSAEARVQPGRAQRLQEDMKVVSEAVYEVGVALAKGLEFAADLKVTPQLRPMVNSSVSYLWAMSAEKFFVGFDWNGVSGVRVQTSGFRFVIMMDFIKAEEKLREMDIAGDHCPPTMLALTYDMRGCKG